MVSAESFNVTKTGPRAKERRLGSVFRFLAIAMGHGMEGIDRGHYGSNPGWV